MNRREAIKSITAMGIMAMMPKIVLPHHRAVQGFHFVGLGGGGCNALKHLYNKGIRARYTCINSHERLHLPADVEFIKTAVPRWTDNPMATGQKQPFSLPDEVQNTFSDNAYHILLVALGGCAGTRLALALSAFLQEMNKKNLVICSLPFKFEGRRRMIAGRAIDEMLFSANVRWFDLQVLGNDHGSRPVSEVLEMADEQFYNIFKDSGFA
jgi:cell division protein FtsZ